MALQSAVCSNCGGKIKVDDIDLNGYGKCEHCKTSYKIIDVITIDGLPTVKSLLTTAGHSIQDGNYDKAVKLFNEVLSIKSNCHEAWWGLYICNSYFDRYYGYKDKYGNGGYITKAQILANTINKYAVRAIEYAPSDVSINYKEQIEESLQFIEQVKRGDFDNQNKAGKKGCYIATTVYGSYSCNEVMILRKLRDESLYKHWWGRLFIALYYSISPLLIKKINSGSRIEKILRKLLDLIVEKRLTYCQGRP
jgi:tetratricopeptide (TPR) repeat protein/DNA-directed RNA polymerase subunit RPC12/RpoP